MRHIKAQSLLHCSDCVNGDDGGDADDGDGDGDQGDVDVDIVAT